LVGVGQGPFKQALYMPCYLTFLAIPLLRLPYHYHHLPPTTTTFAWDYTHLPPLPLYLTWWFPFLLTRLSIMKDMGTVDTFGHAGGHRPRYHFYSSATVPLPLLFAPPAYPMPLHLLPSTILADVTGGCCCDLTPLPVAVAGDTATPLYVATAPPCRDYRLRHRRCLYLVRILHSLPAQCTLMPAHLPF